MSDFHQCFFTLGIEEKGQSNCKNANLGAKLKNAIPEGYTKSVFCAENSVHQDSTCKGDSGKCVMFEHLNRSKIEVLLISAYLLVLEGDVSNLQLG